MEKLKYFTAEELSMKTLQQSKENLQLLKILKRKKPVNLDNVVHSLHFESFKKFDCLDCGNCCKTIGPRLNDADVERIARYLKIKPSEFIARYVIIDEDNDLIFKDHPCPFLETDNYCSIYEHRPKACREYPHTDRKRFFQILDLSYRNCETCPVVFSIFGELKKMEW